MAAGKKGKKSGTRWRARRRAMTSHGRGAAWATGFWLLFLFLSLLALALVPMWAEQGVEEDQLQISPY